MLPFLTIVDYINDEACYNLNNNDSLECVQNGNNVVCSLFNDNSYILTGNDNDDSDYRNDYFKMSDDYNGIQFMKYN